MAIDLYSDNSGGIPTSPRISFSFDLSQSDTVPVEQFLRSISSSSVDFNFNVHENTDLNNASMADELFFDGKILPTELKSKSKSKTHTYPTTPVTSSSRRRNENLRSPGMLPAEDEELNLKQQNSKSFWGFKRSSSCGNAYARSLCPITLLSRSHSTGSTASSNSKRSSSSKDVLISKQNRSFQNQKTSGFQKPPLKKGGYGYGSSSNGIRVNPVLNLGFGSFFSGSSKSKSKK